MDTNSTVVWAPAKINLALAITAKRGDGLHSLETIFQAISLADRIKVTLTKKKGIICSCGELSGDKNLAYKAAKIFMERYHSFGSFQNEQGVEIEIEKYIPIQAGLAGGSSDAAAVFKALNSLVSSPFALSELLEMAAQCGSDTAFCLLGGTKWGEGTGAALSELPSPPEMDIILVKPSTGISTAEAYRVFDGIGEFSSLNREFWKILLKGKNKQKIAENLTNSLEKAAISLLPEITQIKEFLIQGGCLGALMSGSGSAVFGIVESETKGKEIEQKMRSHGYLNTWVVKTIKGQSIDSGRRSEN